MRRAGGVCITSGYHMQSGRASLDAKVLELLTFQSVRWRFSAWRTEPPQTCHLSVHRPHLVLLNWQHLAICIFKVSQVVLIHTEV